MAPPQEMEHILEHIKGSRSLDSQPDEFDHRQELTATGSGDEDSAAGETGDRSDTALPHRQKRLQTMVFSATLTLPQHLRKRLKKGQ